MSAPRTLTFFGGAATSTGSMILLEAAGARILLDAGLFQGNVATTDALNRELPLDPRKVDAILLSQAGLAYSGRTPQLVRHGFDGPIYGTPATRDTAAILLAEAAMELAANHGEPLYGLKDVIATQQRFVGQPTHRPLHLRRNLVFEMFDAGHILGSTSIELRTGEGGSHRIIYSGCIGRSGSALLPDPEVMPGEVDTLILGSPFAHASHGMFADAQQHLATIIRDTTARGGQVIIPASSLGPVQELIRTVQTLWRRGQLPELPIWIDSATDVCLPTMMRLHPESLGIGERAYAEVGGPFDHALLHYVRGDADRLRLDGHTGPAIIIAPGESGDTGRAAHHLRRCLGDERHTVIFLAPNEEESVGRLLQEGASEVTILGESVQRRAGIETLTAYSGHADGEEMRTWLRALGGPIKRAFVVHGDDLAVAIMVTILREEGVRDVIVPRQGESFPF
ncbi:MAG: MBL fold metallo-hydrolase [Gemmatimonadetes bacterium]|nr:MBL fold metallo-hydrolase [Gemmatimonadota bacterium]